MAYATWSQMGAALILGASLGLASGCEEGSSADAGAADAASEAGSGAADGGDVAAEAGRDAASDGSMVADGGESGGPSDAGSGDSGSEDSGSVGDAGADANADAGSEAGSDAGASGCDGKGYLICEDFEDTAVGEVPVGWTSFGSPVGVADDHAYGGEHSLRMGAISNGPRRIHTDAAVLGSAHWGRVFYRIQTPVPDAFVHSTLVALSGVGPNVGAAEYRVLDTVKAGADAEGIESKFLFLYNVQPLGSAEFSRETGFLWEFEEAWHCAEWHIDSADQSYTLYLDGDEVLSFTDGPGNFADSEIPSAFGELRVGWNNYQPAPPGFTAWIDEVALDDSRIGCEP